MLDRSPSEQQQTTLLDVRGLLLGLAARTRRIADTTDGEMREKLLLLALEYEQRAHLLLRSTVPGNR